MTEIEEHTAEPPGSRSDGNAALSFEEYSQGLTTVTCTPVILNLEITNRCNLRCVMCFSQVLERIEDQRDMDMGTVLAFLPYIENTRRLELNGGGEALVSKNFWAALEIIPSTIPDFELKTNAVILKPRAIERLMSSPVTHVNISLDAATAETHEKIRGADFDKVVGNIKNLVSARARQEYEALSFIERFKVGLRRLFRLPVVPDTSKRKLIIGMNMTLMRENINEAPAFVRLGHELGLDHVNLCVLNPLGEGAPKYTAKQGDWTFDYEIQQLHRYPKLANKRIREALEEAERLNFTTDLDSLRSAFFEEDPAGEAPEPRTEEGTSGHDDQVSDHATENPNENKVGDASIEDAPDPDAGVEVAEVAPDAPPAESFQARDCQHPWNWLFVEATGRVRPCCLSHLTLGDTARHTPDEIWNGLAMQSLRATMSKNILHSMCNGAPCRYATEMGPRTINPLPEDDPRWAEFDEAWYMATYDDVRHGVEEGRYPSAREHFRLLGHEEDRMIRDSAPASLMDEEPAAEISLVEMALARTGQPVDVPGPSQP